jgi:hypothetical protein
MIKLYTIGYKFGVTEIIERHESEEFSKKVLEWAKDSGYKTSVYEDEIDAGQPRKEVYHADSGTVKFFDEVGEHLL